MSKPTSSGAAVHGPQGSALPRGSAGPPGEAHDTGGHDGAGHDPHGHGEALGPFDWRAWGAGLLGVAAGLAVAACFWLSANL